MIHKKTVNNKGSLTVEAAIIIPIVILSILSAVYIGLLLYQKASVQSAAEISAEAGAAAWVSGVCEVGSNRIMPDEFEKIKLYRRIFDSDKETRLECIEAYASYLSSQNELIKSIKTEVEAVIRNNLFSRRLEVTVKKQYSIPLGGFLRIFGASGEVIIESTAVASIDDPSEFIRTTDYIVDIGKKIENDNPEIKNLADEIRNVLNTINNKLSTFIN